MVAPAHSSPQRQAAAVRPKVMRGFRRHSGSTLGGSFGAAAFDEVALVPLNAAVDKTGRIAAYFVDRGSAQRVLGVPGHLGGGRGPGGRIRPAQELS